MDTRSTVHLISGNKHKKENSEIRHNWGMRTGWCALATNLVSGYE